MLSQPPVFGMANWFSSFAGIRGRCERHVTGRARSGGSSTGGPAARLRHPFERFLGPGAMLAAAYPGRTGDVAVGPAGRNSA